MTATAAADIANTRLEVVDLSFIHLVFIINPLIATLKPQSNGPSYSNTVIGTLAVDG